MGSFIFPLWLRVKFTDSKEPYGLFSLSTNGPPNMAALIKNYTET
jgi:hypothetical protein